MSSIRKSTSRPFSWSIDKKWTISASARFGRRRSGAGPAGSAAGVAEGAFRRGCKNAPTKTKIASASVIGARYCRKGSATGTAATGTTAAALTATRNSAAIIKPTLMAYAPSGGECAQCLTG